MSEDHSWQNVRSGVADISSPTFISESVQPCPHFGPVRATVLSVRPEAKSYLNQAPDGLRVNDEIRVFVSQAFLIVLDIHREEIVSVFVIGKDIHIYIRIIESSRVIRVVSVENKSSPEIDVITFKVEEEAAGVLKGVPLVQKAEYVHRYYEVPCREFSIPDIDVENVQMFVSGQWGSVVCLCTLKVFMGLDGWVFCVVLSGDEVRKSIVNTGDVVVLVNEDIISIARETKEGRRERLVTTMLENSVQKEELVSILTNDLFSISDLKVTPGFPLEVVPEPTKVMNPIFEARRAHSVRLTSEFPFFYDEIEQMIVSSANSERRARQSRRFID